MRFTPVYPRHAAGRSSSKGARERSTSSRSGAADVGRATRYRTGWAPNPMPTYLNMAAESSVSCGDPATGLGSFSGASMSFGA